MSKIDSGVGSAMGGIILKQRRTDDILGIAFQTARSSSPNSASDHVLYRSGDDLYWWNGSTATLLGSAGSGTVIPSLDGIFAGDKTLNVAGTTLTIDNSTGNNNVLTLTNSGAGSGAALQFDNAGSGSDIDGTNDSWSISKTGVAILEELTIDGTEGSNIFTVTKGDVRFLDSALAVTDDDNAASFTVTNNTATTASVVVLAGSGAFTGSTTTSFMTITPSGLTTGTAVYLPVAALTTGKALHVVADAVTSGIVVHVSSSAAGTQLTGAGRLFLIEHSGNASGTGTVAELSTAAADETVLLKLTASGALALGTVLQISGSSVTTGTAISAADLDALTTGIGLSLASTSTAVTTGSLIRVSTGTTGAVATNGIVSIVATAAYTSTSNVGLLNVVADSITTGATVANISMTAATTSVGLRVVSSGTGLTSGSLAIFTTGTTGALATNGAVSLRATGDYTSASMIDGGLLDVRSSATTAGLIVNVVGAALTTGVAVSISNGTAATTSGSLLRVAAGGTGAVATNGIVSFTHTGVYTSTSAVDGGFVEVKASGTTAGTIVNVVGAALTTGIGLQLSNATSGMTSGSLLRVTASGTGTVATNGIVSITHAGIFVSTSNAGVLDVRASAMVGTASNGTLVNFMTTAAAQVDTTVLNVENSGFTTGYTGSMLRIKSPTTTGACRVVDLIADGITTGGTAMKISVAALTTGDGLVIDNGTAATTTGSLLKVTAGGTGAVSSDGIVSFQHSGVYTSTTVGFVNVSASATTGGSVMTVTGAAVTDGVGLQISNAAITTGTHLSILGAAGASMFTVKVDGATVIAGSAIGTASLTQTAGDHVLSSGNLILTAGHIKNTPQAIVNANTAISIVTLGTTIANNGASTHTLADGSVGQLKYIVCTVYTGDAVITPTNFVGTTITLNAAGDSWLGVFVGTEWVTLAVGGTAAVA